MKVALKLIGFVIAICIALGVVDLIHNPFGHGAGASSVATLAGASSCDDSGYYLKNRLDGSEQTVYDCLIRGRSKCVTVTGGIASDSTLEVRLLFKSVLGSAKPGCLYG